MTLTKDHIGGLVFLCLSIAYGYYAKQIPMLPGDEFEPFHAQTLPTFLSYAGAIISVLMIVTGSRSRKDAISLTGYNFMLVAKLLVLILVFAFALKWVGFVLSTIVFLMGGYWLLGVRDAKTLIVASVPFAVGIWFILAQLLDIYLAPGRLFETLLGG
ncbi:tripartite tricarboxylate transporter TctB family protein [Parasalinivibrio latis]|uniref:tripartite tricarboxylate transporter TctB family protein n=1 Tax=Parasalinivibrio latis TaxID=2952610 RepID=UPI003DA6B9CE